LKGHFKMNTYIGSSNSMRHTLNILDAGRKSGKPVLLWGPPGVGKTALIRAIAEKHNLPLYILVASTMDPSEINGLPALKRIEIKGEEVVVTENTLQYWAEALIREGKGILFFDEASTAVPATQASLLSVLQGRMVGNHTLPKDVWMIAAANEAEDAADGWTLAPPMANRFLHINYVPDKDDWYEGMMIGWGRDDLSDREVEERAKVVAFLKDYPALLNKMPKTEAEAGKAWPSMRSWDNLAEVLAYLDFPAERSQAAAGYVGETAANQFSTWAKTLKLPDYDKVISKPEDINWTKLSTPEVYIVLSMILNRMNDKNVEQSAHVFKVISEVGKRTDVCVSFSRPMCKKIHETLPGDKMRAIKIIANTFQPYLVDLKAAKLA
jgi:adenylate kinase family enzyme